MSPFCLLHIIPSFVLQLSSRSSFPLASLPHSTSDESHPSCPIGRSSPCHPLHREPGDCSRRCCCCCISILGEPWIKAGGHSGLAAARRLSHQPVAVRLLACPLFLFFFFSILSSLAFSFLFCFRSVGRSLFPLPTSNHHLISVSPAASALHRLSPGIARRKLGRFSLLLTHCRA